MSDIRDKAAQGVAVAREGGQAPRARRSENARLRGEVMRLKQLIDEHAQERVSLQALIDAVPDYLWVKDVGSAFVIANKAVLDDNRTSERDSLIGVNDFALHPPERARKFFEAEQRIVKTGESVLDLEELIVNTEGFKRQGRVLNR
jgi:PAS domain-containing protein